MFEFGPNHLSMGTEATQIGYFTPADRDLDHVQRIRNRDCTVQCTAQCIGSLRGRLCIDLLVEGLKI